MDFGSDLEGSLYGAPAPAPAKSRAPLYIGLAVLAAGIVVAVVLSRRKAAAPARPPPPCPANLVCGTNSNGCDASGLCVCTNGYTKDSSGACTVPPNLPACTTANCKNGTCQGGACVCTQGWSSSGGPILCDICATGYGPGAQGGVGDCSQTWKTFTLPTQKCYYGHSSSSCAIDYGAYLTQKNPWTGATGSAWYSSKCDTPTHNANNKCGSCLAGSDVLQCQVTGWFPPTQQQSSNVCCASGCC